MRTTALAFGVAALLMMGGCNNNQTATSNGPYGRHAGPETASTSAASANPEELGRIGAQIRKHPKEAGKILSEHGMDGASFEKAIRAVSSSPDQSRRYRDAYRKAGA